MSAASDYLEAKVLDHVLNAVSLSPPDPVYLALYTDDPTDADSGTEVTGGSYARQAVNPNGGSVPTWALAVTDGVGKMVTNADDVTFPTASAAWGSVTHIGVRDAVSAGNLLWHGALDDVQVVGNGGIFKIEAGALDIRME